MACQDEHVLMFACGMVAADYVKCLNPAHMESISSLLLFGIGPSLVTLRCMPFACSKNVPLRMDAKTMFFHDQTISSQLSLPAK